jgi:cysteine-rich repeat protein
VWGSGRFGGGLAFDGVDDVAEWGYAAGAPVNNFTMMAWAQATTTHEIDAESSSTTTGTTGQNYLFGADHRQADAGAGVSVGTNGITVYEHGEAYMPPLAVYDVAIGTGWNHIAVTYTDRQPRIYLNGVLVKEGLVSARSTVYAPTRFGGGPYGFFAGLGDEVRIYDRPLTAAEILAIMQNSYQGELCDDGNFTAGDGCSTACTVEPLP